MRKFYCSLTVADKNWTDEQRATFEASMFNNLAAERSEAIGNLYTFELRSQGKNDAFIFATQCIGTAFYAIGVQTADYYLTVNNTRGFNTHMTV